MDDATAIPERRSIPVMVNSDRIRFNIVTAPGICKYFMSGGLTNADSDTSLIQRQRHVWILSIGILICYLKFIAIQ
jgi:hypothetical protein